MGAGPSARVQMTAAIQCGIVRSLRTAVNGGSSFAPPHNPHVQIAPDSREATGKAGAATHQSSPICFRSAWNLGSPRIGSSSGCTLTRFIQVERSA